MQCGFLARSPKLSKRGVSIIPVSGFYIHDDELPIERPGLGVSVRDLSAVPERHALPRVRYRHRCQSPPPQFGSGSSGSSGAGQFGSGTVSGPATQSGTAGSQFALSNSAAIRGEIHRFESVHPNIMQYTTWSSAAMTWPSRTRSASM